MIGNDLLRYAVDQEYVVFDFETSGLNLAYDVPWQCSYMICTLNRVISRHNSYVKWDNLSISRGAAAVTGFNEVEYKQLARDPREILEQFESAIMPENRKLLGHNILGYDVFIHNVWRRRLGLAPNWSYLNRCIDTNALAKAYKKGFSIDRSNLTAFQYKMLDYHERGLKSSLSTMAKELQIPFNEFDLHRGHKDIELNWEVWRKLVWQIEV